MDASAITNWDLAYQKRGRAMTILTTCRQWLRIPVAVLFLAMPGTVWQASAEAKSLPEPIPIAGGDVLGPPSFPPVLIHQFLPGPGTGFDG